MLLQRRERRLQADNLAGTIGRYEAAGRRSGLWRRRRRGRRGECRDVHTIGWHLLVRGCSSGSSNEGGNWRADVNGGIDDDDVGGNGRVGVG